MFRVSGRSVILQHSWYFVSLRRHICGCKRTAFKLLYICRFVSVRVRMCIFHVEKMWIRKWRASLGWPVNDCQHQHTHTQPPTRIQDSHTCLSSKLQRSVLWKWTQRYKEVSSSKGLEKVPDYRLLHYLMEQDRNIITHFKEHSFSNQTQSEAGWCRRWDRLQTLSGGTVINGNRSTVVPFLSLTEVVAPTLKSWRL